MRVYADRIWETSTTTGTGTYTLGGTVTGYRTFASIGNGNTCTYLASDGTDWEVGSGTYTSSGTTLSRDTIYSSSNSGSAVNWGSGTRQIFCSISATQVSAYESAVGVNGIQATSGNIASGQVGQFHIASGSVTSGRLGVAGTPTGSLLKRRFQLGGS